ncbi:MAG TPA: DUF503 domain-containing protein [Feifaniaceae bacterium]|nr:DUF503 domain-containing protein [Feifaniaceae bacterium]
MRIAVMKVRLHANWVHGLKEKRSEVKSLCAKIRAKFNVSVAEAGEQDIHQIIVLGIAAVVTDSAQGDSTLSHVLSFLEENTQAAVTGVEQTIY